jgi:hypothetical protein
MTASIRRSTLERYNQKKSISGKEWLADLVGEAAAKNVDWASPSAKASRAQKPKPKTYETSPAILPQRTPSLQNLRTRALVLVHVLFPHFPKHAHEDLRND